MRKWVRRNLKPLSLDSDTSQEHWLDDSNYPLWRRQQIAKEWLEFTHLRDPHRRYTQLKAFIKDESYPDFKQARGIYSRSDGFKALVGPIFKLIENEVFKIEHFIKKVPVADRPRNIVEGLTILGNKYYATDYTTFEASFRREVMEACEFELYDYMLSTLPDRNWFMDVCHKVLGGKNVCKFREFIVVLMATRMSGEMCTSLGNGFTNLMVSLFLAHKNKVRVALRVEGDDGLISASRPPYTKEQAAMLGFDLKIVEYDRLEEASFCGLIFDPEEMINITNPIEVLANFGWTNRQYVKARKGRLLQLLRSKALSMAHSYPRCPIISKLAHRVLFLTRSIDIRGLIEKDRSMSMYDREWFEMIMKTNIDYREPGPSTRMLVEKLVPQAWIKYYNDYVVEMTPKWQNQREAPFSAIFDKKFLYVVPSTYRK